MHNFFLKSRAQGTKLKMLNDFYNRTYFLNRPIFVVIGLFTRTKTFSGTIA